MMIPDKDVAAPVLLGIGLICGLAYASPPPPILWAAYSIFFGSVVILSSVLPGKLQMNISYHNRVRTPHKANALSVLLSEIVIYSILVFYHYWPYNWGYLYFWDTFLIANTISLLVGIFIFIQGKMDYKITRSANTTINNIKSFWNGISKSPRFIYYSLGQLELDRFSFLFSCFLCISVACNQYYRDVYVEMKPAAALYFGVPLFCYLCILGVWIFDKFFFEMQQTYSNSFLLHNIGWKTIWWKSCIVPFFYTLPVYSLASVPSYWSLSPLALLFIIVLFSFGLVLSRGSVQQRYLLKTAGPKAIIWGDRPIVVEFSKPDISDVVAKQKRLLVSGWWGVMRHPRHLGEGIIILSLTLLALTVQFDWKILLSFILACGYLLWKVYTVEQYCCQKYGDVWRHYCLCVPFKLFPYIF